MTKISNLPKDLVEEVLSRVPLTSLRNIRLTCKKWNILSKGESFAKKHLGDQAKEAATEREFMMVMMMDFRVYLMRVNLHNDVESCIKPEGELICLDEEDDVSQVFHCDGLLLCIMEDNTRIVVWNPYWGHTWWIVPTHNFHKLDVYTYALGYKQSSKSCRSYKILRFIDFSRTCFEFKIYNINSDSWKVLDVSPDWKIDSYSRGVSLKGNTYWFARERQGSSTFLVCFDFTRERFRSRFPLPIQPYILDTVSLSSVREEQLAVLFQRSRLSEMEMEIWITTKLEPNAVSWNSKVFLAMDIGLQFQFQVRAASFFIDEEKKVVVVFDKEKKYLVSTHNIAYIFGEDGTLEQVDLGLSADKFCYPLVCCYVPSLVQL
ncbi:putative F-box protein At3g24580 [Arabidopsis lyrata subsp. lyrata]|nr:putative F-box protein At3g24580 [Arabidopsis lyrata subsp. lyrata]|eukprot:XP_020888450.1 putative F-box protein At3g24580 [Arabidopsis lyrata subsp. lyrata]